MPSSEADAPAMCGIRDQHRHRRGGAALLAVGISQCQLVSTFGQQDELLCNSGYVLPPLGGTIGGLGAIGMIASGIVLGIRTSENGRSNARFTEPSTVAASNGTSPAAS